MISWRKRLCSGNDVYVNFRVSPLLGGKSQFSTPLVTTGLLLSIVRTISSNQNDYQSNFIFLPLEVHLPLFGVEIFTKSNNIVKYFLLLDETNKIRYHMWRLKKKKILVSRRSFAPFYRQKNEFWQLIFS